MLSRSNLPAQTRKRSKVPDRRYVAVTLVVTGSVQVTARSIASVAKAYTRASNADRFPYSARGMLTTKFKVCPKLPKLVDRYVNLSHDLSSLPVALSRSYADCRMHAPGTSRTTGGWEEDRAAGAFPKCQCKTPRKLLTSMLRRRGACESTRASRSVPSHSCIGPAPSSGLASAYEPGRMPVPFWAELISKIKEVTAAPWAST